MVKSSAILIRKWLLTDTSLIVLWSTLEQGLVRTVAKGARRPGSVFAGRLDLFYAAEIVWVPAKRGDLHTLKEVEVEGYREGIAHGWDRLLAAAYFASLVEMTAEPGQPMAGLHDLLRRGLDWLEGKAPTRQGVWHFERELAVELGIHGEEGVSPAAAILNVYHRLPPQREELLGRLG